MNAKQLILAGMMATTLGVTSEASAVTALSVGMDFKGYVTMLDSAGYGLKNSSFAKEAVYHGYRTPISGHMVMDITETGMVGTATFEPFLFFGTQSSGRDIKFVPVDTLYGTPIPSSTLLMGNMLFDFGVSTGIPVSIVLDMGNLTTALMTANVGDIITGVLHSASDNTIFPQPDGSEGPLPIGPVVVATTTWNTTDVDTDGDGQPGPLVYETNPSGTIPLLVDTAIDMTNGDVGIGGSPLKIGPFIGYSPNFDITTVTVTCVNALLGSCSSSGLATDVTLDPAPLQPLQDSLGGLVKKLGL